ncbi:MAG: hypothetical protein CEE42_07060 [Promethearchaeota archaeon Loki_b31]|nr:MAG: hypothetical protein CEE42_07060 [Candidatus Lokiarchaeota archaeon Loki_b31]
MFDLISILKEDKIISLLNLLIQEQEFLELNEVLQENFNIFQLLDIETKEVHYSKVLSKFLDPLGNHGLGDQFLKLLLKTLIRDPSRHTKFNDLAIEYIDIDCSSMDDVFVNVEQTILSKRRIDIFIQINFERETWIIVIENKLFAKESPDQTTDYARELAKKYPEHKYKKICIYLTPNGDHPVSNEFIPCSWEEIYQIITTLLKSPDLREAVRMFLTHFSNSIKVFIVDNPKLDELCEKLFNKYPEVLDFLLEKYAKFKSSPVTERIKFLESQLKKLYQKDWEFFMGYNWINFFKKDWKELQDRYSWVEKKTQYFSLVTFQLQITDKNDLRLYFYSYGYERDSMRRAFKGNFIDDVEKTHSMYNQYLNTNLNTNNMFHYIIAHEQDQKDDIIILKLLQDELGKILKEYEPILEKNIRELTKVDTSHW